MIHSPHAHAIAPASLAHAHEIAALSSELGYQTSIDETRTVLSQLLDSSRHFVAVAAAPDGRLLGWVVAERRLMLESGEFVELTGLVVTAALRRSGVGSLLVEAAEQWAWQQGFRSIRVRSNVARNESHPFYERLGYQRTKTQHSYRKTLQASQSV
ncbi:MAG: GNAT family N-acetyltransferase [Paucibacter sp.]|nr:GNAT family N-acetyltransferase [Roseateles sp.]